MSKYNIEFSSEARKDLKAIICYIADNLQEHNIATKLSNKIKENIYNLSENPKIYKVIDDMFLKKLQLRKCIVDNYLIFYKVIDEEKVIQIVRIMYKRRNWINLL